MSLLLARNGPQAMSAIWSLKGEKRTSRRQPNLVAIDPPRTYDALPCNKQFSGLFGNSVATQGRDLSTLASLRALWARTPEQAWARRAVGEGVKFCQ